ncbi:N-glycosyltransferase [Yersinia frederiksenii]|uniref:glycosyltransferase n=1 Tax=Yersinia frederiksenii TaxID=29484 RepID=UPI0005DBCD12|nr:glycosyltransferase [Yersinia frederiksenii]CNC72800.1 N-glycosyltransferase [Yersinia frederiksenii]
MIFTVVMVSYNRDVKLKESLKQLLKTSLHEIVVVDNNSKEITREILEDMSREDSRLKIIQMNENKGASFGFYQGLMYLENKYSSFITTFLDDDAYFEQKFLDGLITKISNSDEEFSYLSPRVVNKNGLRLNMNRPMTIIPNTVSKTLKYVSTRRKFGNKNEFVEAASFIGLTIINTEKEKYSSLIPTDYFIYFDDLVFTYRLSKNRGIKGIYLNELTVIHDMDNGVREYDVSRLSYILTNSIKFNKEVNGRFFMYPLIIHCYHFINSTKNMKLPVFFKALLRKR